MNSSKDLDMDKFNTQVMDLCRRDRIVDARSVCVSALSEELTDAARAKVYKKLAYVESRSGNHDISIGFLQRARSLDPSHRGIIHALMCAYVRNNEFERAVEIADELIALDARFTLQSFTSDVYFHKAYACWRLGRFEEAKSSAFEMRPRGASLDFGRTAVQICTHESHCQRTVARRQLSRFPKQTTDATCNACMFKDASGSGTRKIRREIRC